MVGDLVSVAHIREGPQHFLGLFFSKKIYRHFAKEETEMSGSRFFRSMTMHSQESHSREVSAC